MAIFQINLGQPVPIGFFACSEKELLGISGMGFHTANVLPPNHQSQSSLHRMKKDKAPAL